MKYYFKMDGEGEVELREAPVRHKRQRDATDPVDGLGSRLAAYRTERAVRASDLARQVGVSPSLISQIERGLSRPSVSTLFAIAEALDVPVDAFFRERAPGGDKIETDLASSHEKRFVVRRGDRAVIDMESGVRWERLTPGPLRDAEFLELVYGPHAESHPGLYQHPGEEMILVLSGKLDIHVGFECYHLKPGDSMHLHSMQPHRYVNPTAETTHAVTTILRAQPGHERGSYDNASAIARGRPACS